MLTVLLPAYNEAAALPRLLADLQAALPPAGRILVVDDGSKDGTAELAEAGGATVIRHGTNQGLGRGMRTGFEWIVAHQESAADVLVVMDADNTHPASLIEALVQPILNGQADVVIASRYAPGGREVGLAPHRRFLSRGASLLLGANFPIPGARDYTCGYRAYRVTTLAEAFEAFGPDGFVTQRGFACMAEILIKLSFQQARVSEVGLVLRYDLKEGLSKLPVQRTITQYLRMIGELKGLRGRHR